MKGLNLKKYLLVFAVCAIIAIIAYSSGQNASSTNAAYKTEISGTSSARVAKWDINSLDKNGQKMSLSADVQNIQKGTGNWFLEIDNKSEVAAEIDKTSKIILKLNSEIFNVTSFGSNVKWDFLTNQDNPIKFVVYLYDYKLSDVIEYQDSTNNVISLSAYNELDETTKVNYTEVVKTNLDSDKIYKIIDTSVDDLINMSYVTETTAGVSVSYLTQEFTLESFYESISKFGINLDDNKTIRIEWAITGDVGNTESDNQKFTIYNSDGTVKEEVDLFSYQKYISSLKGEPSYSIIDNGQELIVKHSKLTPTQMEWLNSLAATDELYYQKLLYDEYNEFNEYQRNYLMNLSYLQCGLSCSFILELKVVQVD